MGYPCLQRERPGKVHGLISTRGMLQEVPRVNVASNFEVGNTDLAAVINVYWISFQTLTQTVGTELPCSLLLYTNWNEIKMATHCLNVNTVPYEHYWWTNSAEADIDCKGRRGDYRRVGLSLIVVRQGRDRKSLSSIL